MTAIAYRSRLETQWSVFLFWGDAVGRNTDGSIPGVLEGRQHALTLLAPCCVQACAYGISDDHPRLYNFLMSRANSIDFLDSSGWPWDCSDESVGLELVLNRRRLSHQDVLKHLYPPDGPGRKPCVDKMYMYILSAALAMGRQWSNIPDDPQRQGQVLPSLLKSPILPCRPLSEIGLDSPRTGPVAKLIQGGD